MPALFITGTDTGVGKTWFTCWLVRQWREQGMDAVGLKPISAGDRDDAKVLREASGNTLPLDDINPIHLREPASPLVAARVENRELDFSSLNRQISGICSKHDRIAVEGVGGWRVPLARNYEVRDWAHDLGLPVVVVARNALGTLNHTLLTVASIRDAGLTCAGVVLNGGPDAPASPDLDLARRTHAGVLIDLLRLPVLDFDRRVEAAGEVPVWLGGKEI